MCVYSYISYVYMNLKEEKIHFNSIMYYKQSEKQRHTVYCVTCPWSIPENEPTMWYVIRKPTLYNNIPTIYLAIYLPNCFYSFFQVRLG